MIIYSGNKTTFQKDVMNNRIAACLDSLFQSLGVGRESAGEFLSWQNSLGRMALIMSDPRISPDVQVALEYQIPLTAKRVDFMVGGTDGKHDNVVIVELKQWQECEHTDLENVVNTFVGGAKRNVAHPSQQAWSYAKLIEGFNQSVRDHNINLIPCAYLHNFRDSCRDQLFHPSYEEVLKEAPAFLGSDGDKLADFIAARTPKPTATRLFDLIEHGKLKPSQALQDVVGSILNGNREFEMIDEQQVAYATIRSKVKEAVSTAGHAKKVIIVEGGPGTGKSVIAINLLASLIGDGFSSAYVTKTSAPRANFSKSFLRGKHTLGYLKGLFKSSGSFIDSVPDTFDCLIADESHRLVAKSGMYGNLGENQIREIINAARVSVFFIDEDQVISIKDIGSIDEIKKQAGMLGADVYYDPALRLTSQFRCNGSDGYLAFLDDLLGIRETANARWFDLDYDIRVFDSAVEMREALREKNKAGKARMIAGYCYPWVSDKNKSLMDIVLPDGFEAQWNFSTDEFASDPNSFEQVGCIHSTQGLEFDYVGIIIGKDLQMKGGKVVTDYTQRYLRRDKTISKSAAKAPGGAERVDRIIRNTYKTLLSRGQKGCFVWCEDPELARYIRQRLGEVQAQMAAASEYWVV